MKFTKRYTTNWHDTDADRRVRATRLLVYMQETSSCHMASLGSSLDGLRDKKRLSFILSKLSLAIYRPLYASENIDVETWTCKSKGFSFIRCFRIKRGEDIIAEAYTSWALIDVESKKFCRVSDSGYEYEDEEPLSLDLPQRFRLPEGGELCELGQRRIVYSDLDYNMHMNNTKYPDMLCDFMPIDKIGNIKGMVLSYLREAAFGDVMSVRRCEKDGVYYFRTVNSSNDICLEAQVVVGE